MQRQFVTILFLLLTASYLEAKCGNSIIYIGGAITGTVADLMVSVQVSPDPNWEPQPPISIDKDGKFHAKVLFDRTSEGLLHLSCSRQPNMVTVEAMRDGRVIDQAHLTIKHDFVTKDRTDYETRSPVELHSN